MAQSTSTAQADAFAQANAEERSRPASLGMTESGVKPPHSKEAADS
jgi:hypothetical protein